MAAFELTGPYSKPYGGRLAFNVGPIAGSSASVEKRVCHEAMMALFETI